MSVETVIASMILSRSVLLEAAQLALRVLRFRGGADRLMKGLQDQAGQQHAAAAAALKVLEDIQHDEHRSLADLNDDQANKYAEKLADLVQKRVEGDLGPGDETVEEKLKDIRSTYG